jgi:hypothetical protein
MAIERLNDVDVNMIRSRSARDDRSMEGKVVGSNVTTEEMLGLIQSGEASSSVQSGTCLDFWLS